MKRQDGVQLKFNKVQIDKNSLSVKPLLKIIEFLG